MKFHLKNLPPKASHPEPPRAGRWFIFLVSMLAFSVLLARMAGTDRYNFWIFALIVPAVIWFTICGARMMMYLWLELQASSIDRRREQWILNKTRCSRRAFQVLLAECVIAGQENNVHIIGQPNNEDVSNEAGRLAMPYSLTHMMSNKNLIRAQTNWKGEEGCRHSRIAYQPGLTPNEVTEETLVRLAEAVKMVMLSIPENNPVVVLFESSGPLPVSRLQLTWRQAWQKNGLTQPLEYAEGSGLGYVNTWLNERIHDDALLLVIAIQIAPKNPQGTGEAVVALLLGNRLTQKTLKPMALLHRPDCSTEAELETGLEMAAYHVPLNDIKLQHLWQCGLSQSQREAATIQYTSPLLASVKSENIYDVDGSLGTTGCVAPWLAVAAAAQAAQKLQNHQLIITSDSGHEAVWSALVSPITSEQELDK